MGLLLAIIACFVTGGALLLHQYHLRLPHMAAPNALWLLVPVVLFIAWQLWKLYWRLIWIESCLVVAERELNALILRGRDHGGRKGRVAERYEWNALDKWAPATRFVGPVQDRVADKLIDENEQEVQGHRKIMAQVKLTAFLLRQLMGASPHTAKLRIISEFRNNGRMPYIAAGIDELLAIENFNSRRAWSGGANWRELGWVVRKRGFPRDIVMTRTDANGNLYEVRNMDVLNTINAQRAL